MESDTSFRALRSRRRWLLVLPPLPKLPPDSIDDNTREGNDLLEWGDDVDDDKRDNIDVPNAFVVLLFLS